MGTCYFWKIEKPAPITLPTGATIEPVIYSEDPKLHIGKRSGAGRYCWGCRMTLCMGGEKAIHFDRSAWHKVCPKCTKAPEFGACSFTWAQDPNLVRQTLEKNLLVHIVEDEYGTPLTGAEFLIMLKDCCPIEFTDSIGSKFS